MAAEYMAKWGNKGFRINANQIAPIMGLSTSLARKSDTDDTSGQTTNTRGMELQSIKLETTYLAGAGVDPRGQITDWQNQFGQRHPLIINGQQFGPPLLELESVDFSNIVLSNTGKFLRVDASITLVEYVPTTKNVSSKSTSSGKNAAALSAGPSSNDKASKKTTVSRG